MPVPHTIDEVDEFKKTIDKLVEIESNSRTASVELAQPVTERAAKEIRRWVENEQAMCALSNSYWESRYARVCCPAEAPIWMGDYTFKPISEVKIGDQLIGFVKRPIKNKPRATLTSRGRRWTTELDNLTKTTVTAIHRCIRPIIKVMMESGNIIRCSPDHLWSSGENDRGLRPWIMAREGKRLRRVVDVYPNEPPDVRLAAWLGGVYDGEGSGASIAQDKEHNPKVHQKLIDAMKMFNFEQKFRSGKCEKGSEYKGFNNKAVRINGEITGKAKFAAWCKPVRISSLEKKILQTLRAYRDRIIKIELDGKGEVFALTTETGNYVAYGYASKNCDEQGRITPFRNRKSQEVFDAIVEDFDERQVSIEMLCLKGRQVGVTTKTALKFIHRLMFLPHTQAVMASVQAEKSELIGRILDIAYSKCPWWLVPRRLPKGKFDNGSVLSIQSGMQATGIAQGWTPTAIHISELADIPKPEKVIEEGLLRATHSSRNLFLVFEGTGGGNTGWLADTWRNAKQDYPKGQHRLRPIFLPWFTATDLYPEADWLTKFPIPFEWRQNDATRKHVMRCEAFVRNTDYLKRVFGDNWVMPREQQWFWEFNYRQAVNNRTQRIWMAQMPADDFEALTGKHDSVFELETIDDLERNVYEIRTDSSGEDKKVRRSAVESYAITGHDIDPIFYPSEEQIDDEKQILRVRWNSNRGQEYEWEMIPLLLMPEDHEENTMDRLLIYDRPERWNQYTLGIDTADGLGKEDEERTVLSLAKNRFSGGFDEQVAEFTSNRVNAAQAVAFAACIGAYYGPCVRDSRGVMFAIEQVGRPGETCQHQLKMMGFHHHYRPKRFDSKKIKEEIGRKEGWWSSSWSVAILMTRFVEAINGGWYVPKSKWLIEELKTLERRQAAGKSKLTHRSGQFDDRVRAAAQSFFCAHDLDVLADRAQKRYSGPKKDNGPRPIRQAGQVSVGSW